MFFYELQHPVLLISIIVDCLVLPFILKDTKRTRICFGVVLVAAIVGSAFVFGFSGYEVVKYLVINPCRPPPVYCPT